MTISGHQSRRGAGRSRPPDEGGNQRPSGALRCTQRRFEALSELQSRAPRHSASYNLELRGTPSADLDVRRRKLIRSNQWQSVAISGNQWQSVADLDVRRRKLIRSNQWQSVAISGNQWQSVAISGNQWPTWMFVGGSRRRTSSEANAGERRGSDLAGGRAVMSTCKAGHQRQSVAMYHFSGPPSPPS